MNKCKCIVHYYVKQSKTYTDRKTNTSDGYGFAYCHCSGTAPCNDYIKVGVNNNEQNY